MAHAIAKLNQANQAEQHISHMQNSMMAASYIVLQYLSTKSTKSKPRWEEIFPAKALEKAAEEIRRSIGILPPEKPRKTISDKGNIHALKALL